MGDLNLDRASRSSLIDGEVAFDENEATPRRLFEHTTRVDRIPHPVGRHEKTESSRCLERLEVYARRRV